MKIETLQKELAMHQLAYHKKVGELEKDLKELRDSYASWLTPFYQQKKDIIDLDMRMEDLRKDFENSLQSEPDIHTPSKKSFWDIIRGK